MRRVVAVALALLAFPASAGAVTIQEFPIEPGSAVGTHAPNYLRSGPDGALWIVDRGTSRGIERITTSGQRLTRIPAVAPQDITVGPSGSVYWSETGPSPGGAVRRAPDGAFTTVTENGLVAYSIVAGPGDAVFIGGQRVGPPFQDGTSTPCSVTWGSPSTANCVPVGGLARLTSLAFTGNGLLWGASFENDRLYRWDAGIQALATTFTLPAGSGPFRMAIGPDGNLWITMFNAQAIDRVSPDGTRVRFPLPAGLKGPNDITAGPDGAMWFTEFHGNAIGRITMAGEITEFPVPSLGSAPFGITTGSDGAIWFTQNAIGSVGRLVLDGPGGGGGGGGGGVTDRVAPTFTDRLGVTRARFRTGSRPGRGTWFTFELSEPAKVSITIARKRSGRRVEGRCVAPTSRNRRRSRCDRYVTVGTVRSNGRQGLNAVRFSGRLNGRALAAGAYRATAVATDAAGNASRPSRVAFTVR